MSKIGVDNNAFIEQNTIISVKFGENCTFVGNNAFENCKSLTEINDDNIIESIGTNAFSGNNIESVTFNKLTELYPNAFKGCSNLNNINIPLCKNFPSGVFEGCENLTNITFSQSSDVITIGNYAFKDCTNLSNIDLSKCKTIGDHAFDNCSSIKQITLSSCENIGVKAFVDCNNLTKVYIKNPTDIFCSLSDQFAFCKLDSNSGEYVPNENILFYINSDIIDDYKNDDNWGIYVDYMIPLVGNNQLLYKSEYNELYNSSESDEVDNIYENIISLIDIDNCKFDEKTKIGCIQFNDSVTTLSQIFKDPSRIISVDIPSECEIINENTFEGYTNLTDILLPNTLTEICEYAFKDCKSLTSFTIPSSVTKLGEGIFAGCENIENFYGIYSNVYKNRVVVYKETLISVAPKNDLDVTGGQIHHISEMSPKIKNLGKHCFHGCKKMRRLDIPKDVININDNAFEGCENLCEMRIYGKINYLGKNIFGEPNEGSDDVSILNLRDDFKIFVPESELEYYSGLEYYSNNLLNKHIYPFSTSNDIFIYSEEELKGSGITPVNKEECANGKYYKLKLSAIASSKFENTTIEKVILGDAVTTIYENAFKNCSKLSYIYLPDSIQSLGNNCFEGCTELTRIHIPSAIQNYGDYFNKSNEQIYKNNIIILGNDIFYKCSKLKEFGSYIKKFISDDNRCYVDYNNSELKFFAQGSLSDNVTYTIPENIVTIGRSAFRGSEKISKIIIGKKQVSGRNVTYINKLKNINNYAFEGCKKLSSILGLKNVTNISTGAFMDCVELGEVTLPDGLETISNQAFKNCKKLRINNIPSSVTTLGVSAFEGALNTLLENEANDITLTLPNITTINEKVFKGCKKLKEVLINENTKTIGKNAFEECSELTKISFSSTNTQLNTIDEKAFYNCKKLKNFQLPESLKNIGVWAFRDCESYNTHIPNKLEKMHYGCFRGSGIETLSLKNCSLLTEIPMEAFYECKKLKSIEMGDYIQIINPGSFYNCEKLCEEKGSLILSDNINYIGDSAFQKCSSITSVVLPKKLKKIGDYCFSPDTNNVKLKITITKDMESLPIFTKNEHEFEGSFPFGIPAYYGSQQLNYLEIILSNKFEEDMYSNKYWNKYSRNITINDDYINFRPTYP